VLAIAGWDQDGHEAELKRLCAGLQIPFADVRDQPPSSTPHPPASVIFLGPQFNEAKAACYAHCDGFILPSFSEGVPMVVLEAWAYSKPVLMTPECNLPNGFARGAAIRIEPGVDSIVQGLREFFQASADQRRTLGENGLRLTREQFAWPVLGREMADLYRWLLGGGTKPGCVI
jgi:poly(glycerol-phosphate) alpha-glucosyltransferase